MENTIDGGCACGQIRYRLRAAPMFVNCCHCQDCQRQTGSAFVLNAIIETDRVDVVTGQPALFAMPTDSGRPHDVARCPALRNRGMEPLRRRAIAQFRAGRNPRRASGIPSRRAYLHSIEAALGPTSRPCAGVRGLLQLEDTLAGREPGSAQGPVRLTLPSLTLAPTAPLL